MSMYLSKSIHAAVDSLIFNRGKNNSLILSFTKSNNKTLLSLRGPMKPVTYKQVYFAKFQ